MNAGEKPPQARGPSPMEPDRALTLKPRSLRGSAECLNCGTALQGPFCHYCGQPDRNFMRFFPALIREFMEEFLDLDSRFARTMKPLLFKPGRLTRDYLEGRRFRYTPPLRLYLFASIGFFLLAASLSSNALRVNLAPAPEGGFNVNLDGAGPDKRPLTPEDRADVEQALRDAGIDNPSGFLEGFQAGWSEDGPATTANEPFTADQITVDGKPWNRETNPVVIDFMPGFVNDWINDEIEDSPAKARRINDNPDMIVNQLFDLLPATMFVLLPVVALLFKLWYLFAKRYYIEHLIYALHNHAFIFVSLIVILLLNQLDSTALATRATWIDGMTDWAVAIVSVWIPVYLLISLRHVYQQGWLLTLGKFSVIGVCYLSLLVLVAASVTLLGFLLM